MGTMIYVRTSGAHSWQALLADPTRQWRARCSVRTVAHCWEAAEELPPGPRA
ncbi:DUF6946 family protein [Bradyrhizobium sp. Pa8]|uniref:DUF6946 family protein n=1 Tax=Bradyrhizobium sp. Pa8 TaxID=3386552 RepID=UPI00403FB4F6